MKLLEHKCPLCNGVECYQKSESHNNSIVYACKIFHRKVKLDSSIENILDEAIKRRLLNIVCEDALR